jgi:hypothetical protein
VRKLIATIAATLALAGVGIAAHTATSDAPGEAGSGYVLLPYVEQETLYRA